MSLLLPEGLPYSINGIDIYPSFRNMIKLELLWREEEISEQLKLMIAMDLLYAKRPQNMQKAMDDLLWFYRCGEKVISTGENLHEAKPIYSFVYDEKMIYAAFYQAYGINLSQIPFLHWWEFSALLNGLPEDTQFAKVLAIRTMSLDGMDGRQKAYYKKLKKQVALPFCDSSEKNLVDRVQGLKKWVDMRFETAERINDNGI